MPTKPNRAGQQQNYVPQGNGDASGEYADNSSGSNKHFTNFKKPEETVNIEEVKNTEQPKQEEIANGKYLDDQKREWKDKQNHDTYISMIFAGILKHQDLSTEVEKDEFKDMLRNIFNDANTDALSVISKTMDRKPFEFIEDKFNSGTSYFYPLMNQIHMDRKSFERGFEKQGASLFHEIGHYLNENNKVFEERKWFRTNVKLTDAKTIFDDGKSLADTLQEELKEFSAKKYAVAIRKEQAKYLDERLKQYGFTSKDYNKLVDEVRAAKDSEEWQAIKQKIKNDFDNGVYDSVRDANNKLKAEFENWKKTGSYKEIYEKLDKWRKPYNEIINGWFNETGIHAVSDVWSSKSQFGFGLGHDREYYSKSRNNEPESLLADEFFANVFGSYTVGGEQVLETTKKYFPQSYEKVLKLVEYIKTKG